MPPPFRLTIPEDLEIRFTADRMILEQPGTPVTSVKKPGPAVRAKLLEIKEQGTGFSQLITELTTRGGMAAVTEFHRYFRLFDRMGWIIRSLVDHEASPIAALVPFSQEFRWQTREVGPDQAIHLSRFAHIRNIDGDMVLETPMGHGRLILFHPACALVLHTLKTPCRIQALHQAAPALPPDLLEGLLQQLLNICAIEFPQTETDAADHWEFHDLLFHTRSRQKRRDKRFGQTIPAAEQPAPALKTFPEASLIPLPVPAPDALKQTGPALQTLMEETGSADRELCPTTLGEFLYRTARVIKEKKIDLKEKGRFTITQRPYPGMGSIHGLEIYPLIKDCPGFDSGLYHYHPKRLGLAPLLLSTQKIQPLLDEIDPGLELRYERGIAFVITARLDRFNRFSRSTAYSAALRDLGILLQTMNLTAKAMGLSPGIPYGKTVVGFADLSGIDPLTEAAIGEFILGGTAG